MIPDALTVFVLAVCSVLMALSAVCYARARYHARIAAAMAALARAYRSEAKSYATMIAPEAAARLNHVSPRLCECDDDPK